MRPEKGWQACCLLHKIMLPPRSVPPGTGARSMRKRRRIEEEGQGADRESDRDCKTPIDNIDSLIGTSVVNMYRHTLESE